MREELSHSEVEAALDGAISGRVCVQAWLGVAHVLFLGFGEDVLPPTPPGGHHPVPMYELQIDMADWWVESQTGVLGASTDDRPKAEAAAVSLVGRRATRWQFIEPFPALEISFEPGLRVKMAPYTDSDTSHKEAWVLRIPVYYIFVQWDGTAGIGRRDDYFIDP